MKVDLDAIRARDADTYATPRYQAEVDRRALLAYADEQALQYVTLFGELQTALEKYDALAAENAALRKDAERYRWIRKYNKVGGKCTIELECDPPELCTCEVGHKPHELDAAIDSRSTGIADDVVCAYCGLGSSFDGAWHKPDCQTLNHPIQKTGGPMTGDGDGEGNESNR